MQKQFTFTRTDNLTEYQKRIYDMFEIWGHERFQLLTLLFQSVFTEEEMQKPEYVTSKLVALSQQGFASIRAAPTAVYQPVLITPPLRQRMYRKSRNPKQKWSRMISLSTPAS